MYYLNKLCKRVITFLIMHTMMLMQWTYLTSCLQNSKILMLKGPFTHTCAVSGPYLLCFSVSGKKKKMLYWIQVICSHVWHTSIVSVLSQVCVKNIFTTAILQCFTEARQVNDGLVTLVQGHLALLALSQQRIKNHASYCQLFNVWKHCHLVSHWYSTQQMSLMCDRYHWHWNSTDVCEWAFRFQAGLWSWYPKLSTLTPWFLVCPTPTPTP